MLRRLVDTELITGIWFFEFDSPGGELPYGKPHCFVRLALDRREPQSVASHLSRVRTRDSLGPASAIAQACNTAELLPPSCSLSDMGVVVRADVVHLRVGVSVETVHLQRLLGALHSHNDAMSQLAEFVRRCTLLPQYCILQLTFSDGVIPMRVTGLEIPVNENDGDALSHLLTWMAAEAVLPHWLTTAALAWPGRSRLSQEEPGWPKSLRRGISHVKVVCDRSERATAKVYLVAEELQSIFL